MRRVPATASIASLVMLGSLVTACSDSEGTFDERMERSLEGGAFAQQIREFYGVELEFSEATCATPSSTEPDTTFECSVTGSDGQIYDLEIRIGDNSSAVLLAMDPTPSP